MLILSFAFEFSQKYYTSILFKDTATPIRSGKGRFSEGIRNGCLGVAPSIDPIKKMLEKRTINTNQNRFSWLSTTRYLPMDKADLTKMTAAEKEVINRVMERFSDWYA